MPSRLRAVAFGGARSSRERSRVLAAAVLAFGTAFAAYALDLVAVAGGVVVLPTHAALVGALGAGWIGYRRDGVATAWLVAYAALLGAAADHYLLGLSGRPPAERAAALLQLDGLAFLGAEAIVVGTPAFLVGGLCRRGLERLRDDPRRSDAGR